MRCAVLGDPVDHSLSPVLHNAAYAELGLDDWLYDAVRVPSGGLAELLEHLGDDVRGFSLTMPLKREVMGLAHDVSPRALLAGAANTLLVDDGLLLADNTDLPGLAAALRERHAGPVTHGVLLGAGATAASSGLALADLGAEVVTLLARSAVRAEETRRAIARHPAHPEVVVADLDTADVAGDVLVSSIPAEAQSPEVVARCAEVPVVFEVLYDPWPTPLAASVLDAPGRTLVGGLDLLVHQAVLQVELFTGLPGPLAAMRAAGETALALRAAR
jgi:shikimate dehydrogenase